MSRLTDHLATAALDRAHAATLSETDRLQLWRRVWWYARDPRLCLRLRDSGHWDDAAWAQEQLSSSKQAVLLSGRLMDMSLPQARVRPMADWHAQAMAQVDDRGLDACQQYLWAAVHALPLSPHREYLAMRQTWEPVSETLAVTIVANKWILSGSGDLRGPGSIWLPWLVAFPHRLAQFSHALSRRTSPSSFHLPGPDESSLPLLAAKIRHCLLSAQLRADCVPSRGMRNGFVPPRL